MVLLSAPAHPEVYPACDLQVGLSIESASLSIGEDEFPLGGWGYLEVSIVKVAVATGAATYQVGSGGFATFGVRFDVVQVHPHSVRAARRHAAPTITAQNLFLLGGCGVSTGGIKAKSCVAPSGQGLRR